MDFECCENSTGPDSFARGECKKFTPNIFNKSKCTICFRQKEEHTAEALESNRAARKISKCGYMFVAPGWDFSNPANRTKRWQRRWFVLYDDGELSYSLDEHPDTVPQASIDMNQVMEVADADEVTGNPFSLSITVPDGVHFVKGTSREETKWWKDVLSVLPPNKGRHTLNSAFTGTTQTSPVLRRAPALSHCSKSPENGSKYKVGHSDPLIQSPPAEWLVTNSEDETYPTRDIKISVDSLDSTPPDYAEKPNPSTDSRADIDVSFGRSHHAACSFSPPTRDKVKAGEPANQRQRLMNREKQRSVILEKVNFVDQPDSDAFRRGISSGKKVLKFNQQDIQSIVLGEASKTRNDVARLLIFESEKSKREEKLKDIADSLTKPRPRTHAQAKILSDRRSIGQIKPTRDGEPSDEEKDAGKESETPNAGKDDIIRGDPDGCGLDLTTNRYSPTSEIRVDLPAEDLLNIKKGWLLKQGPELEWTKHWFVLRGVALMYYRDPSAEDKGILDGVIDLSSVNSVSEIHVPRNYGFQAACWDDQRHLLSAVTTGIRNNWMAAIRKAVGLPEAFNPSSSMNPNEKLERDGERCRGEAKSPPDYYFESGHSSSRTYYSESGSKMNLGSNQFGEKPCMPFRPYEGSSNLPCLSIPRSTSCHFAMERYLLKSSGRTSSERDAANKSSGAQSTATDFYVAQPQTQEKDSFKGNKGKDKDGWNKGATPLPPSPPLNRTPISKVKERAKTQTMRSRVYNKRSKSSPPTSRKSSLEEHRVDESPPCEEKREEPIKRSTILDKVDRHVKEIDDLKGQLSLALCERTSAEKELCRLRQRKSEANQQVEELLRSLKVAEDELKSKTQELENFENLKQRYSALVQEHEGMLKSWRESAINDGWREMYQRLKEEHANDKESWEMKLANVTSMLHAATERCEMLAGELAVSEETVEALRTELTNLSERLMRGLEENEGLYGRMRELEGRCLSSFRERGRSVDSLSDLTNIDLDIDLDSMDKERVIEEYENLRGRFEKAVHEIRAMKRELRESHANYDDLELTVISLRQDSKRREDNGKAQAALMASRIEDLTLKLSASEKQSRLLKQKMSKTESREKRRSLSLRGKESFQIGKETEEKLAELEAKVSALETGLPTSSIVIKTAVPDNVSNGTGAATGTGTDASTGTGKGEARLRRKSLESGQEPMKILVRMFSLEQKIAKVSRNVDVRVNVRPRDESTEPIREASVLENVAAKLRECKAMLLSLRSGAPHAAGSALSNSLVVVDARLTEAEALLTDLAKGFPCERRRVNEDATLSNAYEDYVVHKLENLLKTKVTELWNKRQRLLERQELTEEAKLKLTAEKLAYESVLIRKIREIVEESSSESEHWKDAVNYSECEELWALMTLIARKVRGDNNADASGNSLDALSRISAERLYSEGEAASDCAGKAKVFLQALRDWDVDGENLLERRRALANLIDPYKRRKLQAIARFFALETLNMASDVPEKTRKPEVMDDKKFREAWSVAQEALNKEIAQTEISHMAMRCLLMYGNGRSKENEGKLTHMAERYKRQEDYLRRLEESLASVVEMNIKELSVECEKAIQNLRGEGKERKSGDNLKEEGRKCRKAMEDLFTVLTQTAVIDARIDSLGDGPTKRSQEGQQSDRPVVRGVCLKSHPTDLDLETKFIYLYQKFSAECWQTLERVNLCSSDAAAVFGTLNECADHLKRLRDVLRLPGEFSPSLSSRSAAAPGTGINTVRDVCDRIAADLADVVDRIRGDVLCRQCSLLKEALRDLETRHDEEIARLKRCHDKELKDLHGELESQRHSLKQEQAELIERTRLLEKRLGALDAEYSQQMDNLRTAYHKTFSAGLSDKGERGAEDSIRQRYQAEIEQLRTLCEKGLSAVDNSHRRIIAELEEKHRQELAAAAAEKEQALAEETQATLAALDAMRKAHETEVQKEISKFKAEFLKKMQSNHDIGALHKEHEAEMDQIKKEILSLSEKYTVKCVESASLEEQLSHVNKQLTQAQEHIVQLNAKNRNLRAHLFPGSAKSEDSEFKAHKEETLTHWNNSHLK